MEFQPSSRRISLREIAKQLGVSHATVSLALRNNARISAPTREKVQRHAREVGYRPDPMLKTLIHYRLSKTQGAVRGGIAWINAWPDPQRLRGYREFDGYWKGARAEAEKLDYWLEEFRVTQECPPARLHQILNARGIRGILLPPHAAQPDWEDFPWKEYAVVRIGRSLKSPAARLVGSNQMANAMLAFTSMRDRGYRRIGFVSGRFAFTSNDPLFGVGWLAAQEMIPQEERMPAFQFMRYPLKDRADFFRRWLDRYQPDAILSEVFEIHEILSRVGIRVPDDLGLAVTSLLDGGADSGIDQHAEEIGRSGISMLHSLIDWDAKEESSMFSLLVDGRWVDGASLPWKNTSIFDSITVTP